MPHLASCSPHSYVVRSAGGTRLDDDGRQDGDNSCTLRQSAYLFEGG